MSYCSLLSYRPGSGTVYSHVLADVQVALSNLHSSSSTLESINGYSDNGSGAGELVCHGSRLRAGDCLCTRED